MPKEDFFKEIEKFYLEKKGFGSQLSAKEREVVESWFKRNIPVKTIKKLIIQELNRLPISKRKKFSLILVEKQINQLKKLKNKNNEEEIKEDIFQKWKDFIKLNNLPESLLKAKNDDVEYEIQNNIINYLWQKLKEEEKEEIFKKAKYILKSNINLKPEEYKKALKSQIRKEIKKRYNIPD
jgi:polyribonucleotide nucleotidyltransferase